MSKLEQLVLALIIGSSISYARDRELGILDTAVMVRDITAHIRGCTHERNGLPVVLGATLSKSTSITTMRIQK